MNAITLTKAESIVLHNILQILSNDLSALIGQDMTVELDDPENSDIVASAASEFNYDDVEVVDEHGNYNLFSAVNHFLERLETESEGFS